MIGSDIPEWPTVLGLGHNYEFNYLPEDYQKLF